MKTKEEIENLKDVRRNLLIVVLGIVGSVSASLMGTTSIVFSWLSGVKIALILIGVVIVVSAMDQIAFCNKRIDMLIKKIKEN
jgi:hypothetical protein